MNPTEMPVLIVDDDEDIRVALRDLLESHHYTVKGVSTGSDALEQVGINDLGSLSSTWSCQM